MNYYIIMKEWFIRFIEEQRKGYFIRILKYNYPKLAVNGFQIQEL